MKLWEKIMNEQIDTHTRELAHIWNSFAETGICSGVICNHCPCSKINYDGTIGCAYRTKGERDTEMIKSILNKEVC